MTATQVHQVRQLPFAAALPMAIGAAAVVGIVADVVIAAIAHAAGVSHSFQPLNFGSYAVLTVLGLIGGGVAWALIRARAARPAALMRRLVPAVILLSFIPDVAVGVSKSMPHTTWGGVIALMVMHLAVAAAGVLSYRTLLPLDR